MSIDIEVRQVVDSDGRGFNAHAVAFITFSPREGYDSDKLAALERDLGTFVTARLNDALKKGGE